MRSHLPTLALAMLVLSSLPHLPAQPHMSGAQSQRIPDVGYEPTTFDVADAMLRLAGVGPNDVIYDLGSGDGRIVIMAAQRYGARGVGIELEPELVAAARRAADAGGVTDRVRFVRGDLFAEDISPATVVTLYLWPSVNSRLETKLRHELRPGTRVVSNSFGIGNWIPERTVDTRDGTKLLLWIVPSAPARPPDVAFVPTPQDVVREMLELADVSQRDVVYDLGSGDGRIPITAAQTYGAQGVGIELDPRLVEIAQGVARDAELAGMVTFVEGDLFTADLRPATVVTLYLSAAVNDRLEAKLKAELRPGTRVVSRQFAIGNWRPDKTARATDGSELLLWTVPPR